MIKCIETNKEYQSAAQAAKELGITQAAISMCINGKRKKANGFTFIKLNKLNTLNNEESNKLNNEEINKINNEEKLNKLNTLNNEEINTLNNEEINKINNEEKLNTLNNEEINKINNEEKLNQINNEEKLNTLNNEEKLNTLNINSGDNNNDNNNKNDWFTKELEAENQTAKIDTELIKSIIIPCEDNIEPLIDKDALLYKYERERIDKQLKKYIKLPIAHELKEQMILAFYSYVKKYSSPYVDKLKELEEENKSLQQKNDSLIDKLSTYKSEKDALEHIQHEYDNIVKDKSGSYVSETMNNQRKSIEHLQKENYKYELENNALKKKIEENWGDFTVEYERDILLKKVHELESKLGITQDDKVKENTRIKNDFSTKSKTNCDDSLTLSHPSTSSTSTNPHLSEGQIKSSTKRIKDEEENLTWDDI